MKKELVILSKLSPLFDGKRYSKIECNLLLGGQSNIYVEIEYLDEELEFVRKVLEETSIDGYELILDLPTMDSDFKPIKKCFVIIISDEFKNKGEHFKIQSFL